MARLSYLSREDLTSEDQPVYDRIMEKRGHIDRPYQLFLNHPKVADQIAGMGAYVRFDSGLDATVRETAILTIARELNSSYVWTHHDPLARQVGVRGEVIEAIKERTAPRGLLPKEGVFVQFALEMLKQSSVSDATYSAVLHLLGTKGLIDLTLAIGFYAMLIPMTSALDIELEESCPSLLPV